MAEIVCAHCGRTFSAAPGKNRKYCSRACYRADTGAWSEKCRAGGRGSHHGPTFVVPPSLAAKLGISEEVA
jgi:protein-arginine kinase activator protein McsA